jgi:hypothetical protein
MRISLASVATLMVALGLWLMTKGFMPGKAPSTAPAPQITAAQQTTAGPIALGVALLAGGGLLFILLLRKP